MLVDRVSPSQLAVLRRQIDRPALNDADPTLLGASPPHSPAASHVGEDPGDQQLNM